MLKKLREALRGSLDPGATASTYGIRRRQLLQTLAECGQELEEVAESLDTVVALSRDSDGFVREAAIRCLARSPTPAALKAIVLRLNDWVHEVREAARASAVLFLETDRLPGVLAALDAIVRLGGKSRADHSGFIERVGAFLDRPEHRQAVLAHFRRSRGAAARFLQVRLLRWPEETRAEVVRLMTQHKDFLVRSRLLCTCAGAGDETVLRALFADRQPRNRQKAFLALWQRADVDRQMLERALLDPSGAVRGVALWAAKQSAFDLKAFVTALGDGKPLPPRAYVGWLHLLGVLKDTESLGRVESAFTDARSQVRQAALLAWVNISRETADGPTVQALLDDSPKVAKLAGQLLRKGKVVLSGEQLRQIGSALEGRGDLRRQLVFSQNHLAYWEHLLWLLETLPRHSGKPEQRLILQALQRSLASQRYSLGSQPELMQERLRRAMRDSGLGEIRGRHAPLRIALEQFD